MGKKFKFKTEIKQEEQENSQEQHVPESNVFPEKVKVEYVSAFLALLVIIIFGFFAYQYFKQGKPQAVEKDIISSKTERPAEIANTQEKTSQLNSEPLYWTANDYTPGEIKTGAYTVRAGDTLWEIAEAVYGNGSDWTRLRDANPLSVYFLPDGSQALIYAGQALTIP